MREFLTVQSRIVEGLLLRNARGPHLTLLFVEGTTDKLLYTSHTSRDGCHIIALNGRDQVIAAVELCKNQRTKGVLGIIDADTDIALNRPSPSANIVQTDHWDAEAMMLASEALDKALLEFRPRHTSSQIRNVLYSAAAPMAALRVISSRDGLAMQFKDDIQLRKFIDPISGAVSVEKCVRAYHQANPGCRGAPDDLEREVSAVMHTLLIENHLRRGHDMTLILAYLSEGFLGRALGQDRIESILRIGFEHRALRMTELYKRVRGWEQRNLGFVVWRLDAD